MPVIVAWLFLAAPAPPPFDRSFDFSLRSERVGRVHVSFDGQRFRYESQAVVSLPEGPSLSRFWCETSADGRGHTSGGQPLSGPVPSTLALWGLAAGKRCLTVEDEHSGRVGPLCYSLEGESLQGTLLGEPFSAHMSPEGGPDQITFKEQGASFVQSGGGPVPAPRDLFAAPLPAGRLSELTTARSARIEVRGRVCRVTVESRRGGPSTDVAFTVPKGAPAALQEVLRGARGTWQAARALAGFVEHGGAADRSSISGVVAPCVAQATALQRLASSVGITSRVVYGVLVEDGEMSGHAWTEVEVANRWYALDPSRSDASVGPEHIPFGTSDAADRSTVGRCLLELPSLDFEVSSAESGP